MRDIRRNGFTLITSDNGGIVGIEDDTPLSELPLSPNPFTRGQPVQRSRDFSLARTVRETLNNEAEAA